MSGASWNRMCFPFARRWFGAVWGRWMSVFLKVELKARALCFGVSIVLILRSQNEELCIKVLTWPDCPQVPLLGWDARIKIGMPGLNKFRKLGYMTMDKSA
jgi:hypothetical protein